MPIHKKPLPGGDPLPDPGHPHRPGPHVPGEPERPVNADDPKRPHHEHKEGE